MLSLVKYGEVIRAQVKARASQFDKEQEMFLVNLGEGQATDVMTYGAITKGMDMQLQRESEIEDKRKKYCSRTSHIIISSSKPT